MTCVYCHGDQVKSREVEEMIEHEGNIFRFRITTPVCTNCGERYYDPDTLKYLEDMRHALKSGDLKLREVGKILESA